MTAAHEVGARCAFHGVAMCPLPISEDGDTNATLPDPPPPLFPWTNRIADAQRVVFSAIIGARDVPEVARYRTMLAPSVRALLGYLFDVEAWSTCSVVGR